MRLPSHGRPITYQLYPPDYTDTRGERVLLVWKALPYWMVVDAEMHALLRGCDGERPLDELLASRPDWQAERAAILPQLAALVKAGVLATGESRQPGTDQPAAPVAIENISLNLTRRCNLRCRFCYNLPYLRSEADDELSTAEFIAFLRSARKLCSRTPSLTMLGGEPLLEAEKLLAVAGAGRRLGFTTLVSTNGTLVTEAFAASARQVGLQVQVSLDGHTATLHDGVRGRGVFDRAVQGIRTLVRHGTHTMLSLVCHRENLPHLEAFFRLADSLGVNEARFIPLKRMGGAMHGAYTPVSNAELIRQAGRLLTRHPAYLRLAGRDALSILAHTCRYSVRRPSCGTGLQALLLDADGTLYPCLNTNRPEFSFGNIRDRDFDIACTWRRDAAVLAYRKATAIDTMNTTCRACLVRYWCLGGCRGETYGLTGDLSGVPENCADLRETILDIFWLLAEHPELGKPVTTVC